MSKGERSRRRRLHTWSALFRYRPRRARLAVYRQRPTVSLHPPRPVVRRVGFALALTGALVIAAFPVTRFATAGTSVGLVQPLAGTHQLASPTGSVLHRFAPTYMTPTTRYTKAQAVSIARQFDIIAAHRGQFASDLAAMHAANPKVVVLIYLNGTFLQSAQGTLYPNSDYAHDQQGNKITSTKFGNYLMDISNPSWTSLVVHSCETALRATPTTTYDGCFIDTLGYALLNGSFLSGVPINPGTGQPWTTQQRIAATTSIAAAVRTAIAPKLVMANGLKNGPDYFGKVPSSQLFNGVSAALAEVWLRQAQHPVSTFETESVWLQEVDMLAAAGSKGDSVAVTVKIWITATTAEVDQWHKYALASFLLGTTGTSYFSFIASTSPAAFTAVDAWDQVDPGAPSGPFAKVGGVYERQFSKGWAVVNPTAATGTVTFSRACKTLEGGTVTTLVLAPDTGDVCTF
jgi:hypothetical protein